MVLGDGLITDEALNDLKSRIGSFYSVNYGFREITMDAIKSFVEGEGDRNPLWVDEEHAKKSRWGGIIAPPTILYSVIYPTGMRAGGLPGVHSFYSGSNWEWYKPIRLGDVISGTYQLVDAVEHPSRFANRTVIQYSEIKYFNQNDEAVGKTVGWSIRAERRQARDRGKYSEVKTQRYTDEEFEEIFKAYENEQIRGATPRYWEDVNIGDELPQVVKGPFSAFDMSCHGATPSTKFFNTITTAAQVRDHQRHPAWYYRAASGARQTIGAVHTDDDAAQGIAISRAYDVGVQRNCWMAGFLLNWMGDDGFLKKLAASYRRFNVHGDTQWIRGKVTKKYVENGEHLVDVDLWCQNQRGEITAPGKGTIELPSREK